MARCDLAEDLDEGKGGFNVLGIEERRDSWMRAGSGGVGVKVWCGRWSWLGLGEGITSAPGKAEDVEGTEEVQGICTAQSTGFQTGFALIAGIVD